MLFLSSTNIHIRNFTRPIIPVLALAGFVGGIWVAPVSAASVSAEDSLRAGLMRSDVLESERQAFVVARQAIATSDAKNNLTGTFAVSGSHIQTDAKDTAGGFTSSNSRTGSVTIKKQIYDFGEADSRMVTARYGMDTARASYQQLSSRLFWIS